MSWIKAILREIFGLFVEDVSFALALLAWLGIAWWLFPRLGLAGPWSGVILFAGLALILLESVTRFSRRRGRGAF